MMMDFSPAELRSKIDTKIFRSLSSVADDLGLECYVIGGFVRDIFLNRPSKDIDVLVVGSGIDMARAVCNQWGRGAHLSVFRNFGTAQVKYKGCEIEFVGARKESYNSDSRKPVVETGTLEDDQRRRDFTINVLALCLNGERFGELSDPFGGLDDLHDKIIRTPLDPDITFSDDPLRMMRCVRFATQLGFYIEDETFAALERNAERIKIVSFERITDELNKIIMSPVPSKGFVDLQRSGLLAYILPELTAGKGMDQRRDFHDHDVLEHSLRAVKYADSRVRLAALLHDAGKPYCRIETGKYHGHDAEGARIGKEILERLKAPKKLTETVVRLIRTHMYDLDGRAKENKIRAFIAHNYDIYPLILLVKQADFSACKDVLSVCPTVTKWEKIREKMQREGAPFTMKELHIDGNALKGLFPPEKIGGVLEKLFHECLYDGSRNDRTKLLREARRLSQKEE